MMHFMWVKYMSGRAVKKRGRERNESEKDLYREDDIMWSLEVSGAWKIQDVTSQEDESTLTWEAHAHHLVLEY